MLNGEKKGFQITLKSDLYQCGNGRGELNQKTLINKCLIHKNRTIC